VNTADVRKHGCSEELEAKHVLYVDFGTTFVIVLKVYLSYLNKNIAFKVDKSFNLRTFISKLWLLYEELCIQGLRCTWKR